MIGPTPWAGSGLFASGPTASGHARRNAPPPPPRSPRGRLSWREVCSPPWDVLRRPPEGPSLDIPEALLALGLSKRHQAPFEGVPHCHRVAQHALGCHRRPATSGAPYSSGGE